MGVVPPTLPPFVARRRDLRLKEDHLMAEEWGKMDLFARFRIQGFIRSYEEHVAFYGYLEQMQEEPLPHCRYLEHLEQRVDRPLLGRPLNHRLEVKVYK